MSHEEHRRRADRFRDLNDSGSPLLPNAVEPARMLLDDRRHAVRSTRDILEIQLWLGELELHEERICMRTAYNLVVHSQGPDTPI